jgi:hypothetical protein
MTDIVKRLRGTLLDKDNFPRMDSEKWLPVGLAKEAADEIERLREAMQRIVQWAEAYPLDIFHEPSADECKRASKLLQDNGMTLAAFSASMGRHCLDGVKKIATDALSEEPPP